MRISTSLVSVHTAIAAKSHLSASVQQRPIRIPWLIATAFSARCSILPAVPLIPLARASSRQNCGTVAFSRSQRHLHLALGIYLSVASQRMRILRWSWKENMPRAFRSAEKTCRRCIRPHCLGYCRLRSSWPCHVLWVLVIVAGF